MSKIYVDVVAKFSKEGALIPRNIKDDDGKIVEIDMIMDVGRVVNLEMKGVGTRYTCVIGGLEKYLYYEDNNIWFIEDKR